MNNRGVGIAWCVKWNKVNDVFFSEACRNWNRVGSLVSGVAVFALFFEMALGSLVALMLATQSSRTRMILSRVTRHAWNPSTGEMDMDRSQGLTGHPVLRSQ